MIQHIFFDLDHTLWDFETNAHSALHDLYHQLHLARKGVTSFDLFIQKYLYHNELMWNKYHQGKISSDELKWKRMYVTLLEFKIGDEQLAKQMASTFLEILPEKKAVFVGAFETLDYLLAKKYKLHLITNGFEKTQHRKLASSGLAKYFTQVITSEATGFVKPNKEIFDYALQQANATTTNSIMIGDNIEADIKGAYNAGWQTVFANYVAAPIPQEASYTITALVQLQQIV